VKIRTSLVVLFAGLLLAGCAASGTQNVAGNSTTTASASSKKTAASETAHPNEPTTFPGLFGTFYSVIPREHVEYKTSYAAGTIVVDQRKRFLYYVIKGGPENPLGARALYLGSSLYRIHGTSEPWRIGAAASAGCIRLSNDDIVDLYDRTRIGATVVVKN
jgi:lipoprotein-anchoring transpeptidase ErfK/SrfK